MPAWRTRVEVASVPSATAAELDTSERDLGAERHAVKAGDDGLRADCSHVAETETDRIHRCRARQAALIAQLNAWRSNYAAYEHRIADLSRPAAAPAVNPCQYFDDSAVRSATATLAKERALRAGIVARIDDLQRWRGELTDTSREFEHLRAVSAAEELADFLDALPAEGILSKFSETYPSLREALSEANRRQIVALYRATQAALAGAAVLRTEDLAEKRANAIKVSTKMKSAILASQNIAKRDKDILDGFGKAFEAAAILIGFLADSDHRNVDALRQQLLETIVAIAAVFAPPVAAAQGAVGIALLETHRYVGRTTAEHLSDVVSGNWNAERYLRAKLAEIDDRMIEQERIAGCTSR